MNHRTSRSTPVACRSREAPWTTVAMLLLICLGTPAGLTAQAAGGGGMTYEVYSFLDSEATGLDHVSLLTAPLAMTLPVGQSLSLGVYSAWAQGTVEGADGQQASVTGFTDTEVSLGVPGMARGARAPFDRVWCSVDDLGVRVPYGP